jgi:hypothetical protein
MTPEERFDDYRAGDSDEFTFKVERQTIQEGKSFSADAMDALLVELGTFIGGRIMARWDNTGEPPSVLRVDVRVEVR